MFEAVTLFIHASSNSVTMSYSRFLSGNSSWIDLDSQPQLEWYIPVQGRVRLVRENDAVPFRVPMTTRFVSGLGGAGPVQVGFI